MDEKVMAVLDAYHERMREEDRRLHETPPTTGGRDCSFQELVWLPDQFVPCALCGAPARLDSTRLSSSLGLCHVDPHKVRESH